MITPIQTNGIISLTQDTHIIRNAEDSRPAVDYQNAQALVENRDNQQSKTVVNAEDSSGTDTHHDAREEGKNKYIDLRDKTKKKEGPKEGVVVKKTSGGFDLRI